MKCKNAGKHRFKPMRQITCLDQQKIHIKCNNLDKHVFKTGNFKPDKHKFNP